ncbi:MAG: hypothetical protein ACUVTL_06415 [Thermoproteota archaeon]
MIDKDLIGTVLMVQGKYYGMRTMVIRQSQVSGDILSATIVGENLILSITPEEIPKGAAHLQQEVVEGTLDSVAESTFVDVTDKVRSEAPWIINYGSKKIGYIALITWNRISSSWPSLSNTPVNIGWS